MKNKKGLKKRKIRFDRILVFLAIICAIVGILILIFNIKISNIYILNNELLNDQYIIEQADLSSYPSVLDNPLYKIKNKLKSNVYINDVKVYRKKLTKIYIEVEENAPLFYYEYSGKTILENGEMVDKKYPITTVINYITDEYFDAFIKQLAKIDKDVLKLISEVQFKPNEVDDNRFLLTMSDGNFVYINIDTFEKLNMYLSIKESLPKKDGILYLDYGNNFEILK